jgi:DNA (cytosine-5)-methyltransferase 1
MGPFTSLEICAGAGGQALGVERAGFAHLGLVEIDPWACQTLRLNRPGWNVIGPEQPSRRRGGRTLSDLQLFDVADSDGAELCGDVRHFEARPYAGQVDLLAGGVPCPPFSKAGKQLGAHDERDLFPEALRLVQECRPRAVMLENVRGLLDPKFTLYRDAVLARLRQLGYIGDWRLLQAADFGVPQLRPRSLLVALRDDRTSVFSWPTPRGAQAPTVGQALLPYMAEDGWENAEAWAARANKIAPTLVGGSKKHGGPDLGPTRARAQWARLGVDGRGLADAPPQPSFDGMPKLTVRMAARLQGFPADWLFAGSKTHSYRQVGNAFPPPVAEAVARAIAGALAAGAEAFAA